MLCPTCHQRADVIDSRHREVNQCRKRRLFCPACNRKFNTIELPEDALAPALEAQKRLEEMKAQIITAIGITQEFKHTP